MIQACSYICSVCVDLNLFARLAREVHGPWYSLIQSIQLEIHRCETVAKINEMSCFPPFSQHGIVKNIWSRKYLSRSYGIVGLHGRNMVHRREGNICATKFAALEKTHHESVSKSVIVIVRRKILKSPRVSPCFSPFRAIPSVCSEAPPLVTDASLIRENRFLRRTKENTATTHYCSYSLDLCRCKLMHAFMSSDPSIFYFTCPCLSVS
jgi:hypothetical protein